MHRLPPTGLKSRRLVPKTLRSCLGPLDLPYNWGGKLFELLLALSLARSLLLENLARFAGRPVMTGVNRFSALLKQTRLDFSRQRERLLVAILRSLGSRRLYLYRGKVVVIVDTTEHEKRRSLRAPVLTLSRFFEALAMDFARCSVAWRKAQWPA